MKIPDRKRDAHPLETVEEGISGHGRMTGEGSLMYLQYDMGTTEGGISVYFFFFLSRFIVRATAIRHL